MSTPKAAPVAPPSILTAATDDYIARVLSRIPQEKTAIVGVDFSNAGVVGSIGARRGPASAVVFGGKTRGEGWTYGGRAQVVF